MRMRRSIKKFLLSPLLLIIALPCYGELPCSNETAPMKIVSLGPIITDMIYLLGGEEQLTGVTSYCTIPHGKQPKEIIGTVMQMNVEKVISLNPDLVLANTLTREKQIKILEKQGVRVTRLETPSSFDDICKRLEHLAGLIGKQERALLIVKKAREDVEAIKKKAETLPRRSVFIQIGIKPLKTSAKDTFINDYIEFAGGMNIVKDLKYGVFSREKVLQYDPDVILIATMGSSKKAGENEKKAWLRFNFLKACRNNEVHILDPDIVCSPTPETFAKGLNDFFNLIHPDSSG